MNIPLAAASVAAILVAAAFALAPRQEVVTEVGIDATPAQVWALLGDPGSYRDWNPFIVSMEANWPRAKRSSTGCGPKPATRSPSSRSC